MPETSEIVVGLDRERFLAALGILNRCLSRAEKVLAEMTDDAIEVRIGGGGGEPMPLPLPPILASDCRQPFLGNWQELHANEAFAKIAPLVRGVLAELERRGTLPGPISGHSVS